MIGIRNFIVETIIQQSGDETLLRTEKAYLGKLDMTLIQVCNRLAKEVPNL
jgi:hypothetical protein